MSPKEGLFVYTKAKFFKIGKQQGLNVTLKVDIELEN